MQRSQGWIAPRRRVCRHRSPGRSDLGGGAGAGGGRHRVPRVEREIAEAGCRAGLRRLQRRLGVGPGRFEIGARARVDRAVANVVVRRGPVDLTERLVPALGVANVVASVIYLGRYYRQLMHSDHEELNVLDRHESFAWIGESFVNRVGVPKIALELFAAEVKPSLTS